MKLICIHSLLRPSKRFHQTPTSLILHFLDGKLLYFYCCISLPGLLRANTSKKYKARGKLMANTKISKIRIFIKEKENKSKQFAFPRNRETEKYTTVDLLNRCHRVSGIASIASNQQKLFCIRKSLQAMPIIVRDYYVGIL